jgi:hypothetical protein
MMKPLRLRALLMVSALLLTALFWLNRGSQKEGHLESLEHAASLQWPLNVSVSPGSIAVGSLELEVKILSSRSGFITLLQRGTDGTESVAFPNSLDKENQIEAGKLLILPRPHWKMLATPPPGEGRLLALVTENPIDPQSLQTALNHPAAINLGGQPFGASIAVYRERE